MPSGEKLHWELKTAEIEGSLYAALMAINFRYILPKGKPLGPTVRNPRKTTCYSKDHILGLRC